jgi:hypothetical protein
VTGQATFDEGDWLNLTSAEKKAIKAIASGTIDFDVLANIPGVGQKSMDSLISNRLVEEGVSGPDGRVFKLSDKGWLAHEWICGRRTRTFPSV